MATLILSSRIQILRISNIENWFFERAVIPQSSILFEAFQDAKLEVHTSEMGMVHRWVTL
ncbi:MAG: DUF1830 domain-containing protein [Cyanobacteria bacterium J06650_10]